MKKILIALKVVQEKKVKDPLGLTYTKRRLNPFNPLTYLFLVITFVVALLMYGFVGVWEQININELKFKWV